MTSVRGRRRPRQERPSVAPSVAPLDSFPPFEWGDKLSVQPAGPLGAKPPVVANNIPKYSKDALQRIFKAVLEAWAPVPTPALASVISEVSREKLKARFPDVYCEKSHMDCYNFCQ